MVSNIGPMATVLQLNGGIFTTMAIASWHCVNFKKRQSTLAMEWQWNDNGMAMEWQWNGNGMAIEWQWNGNGMAME